MVPGLAGRRSQDSRNVGTVAKFVNKIKVGRLSEAVRPAACQGCRDPARGFLVWLPSRLPQRRQTLNTPFEVSQASSQMFFGQS